MSKLINRRILILITTVSLTGISWILINRTSTALSDTLKTKEIDQYHLIASKNISQQSLLKTTTKNQSTWDKIVAIFRGERKSSNDMGGKEFCSISPNKTTSIIWSSQPLFVWEGTVTKIKVRRGGSDPATIWEYDLKENEQKKQSILYNADGQATEELNPGEIYYYSVTYQETTEDEETLTKEMKPSIRFEVMKAEERSKIQEELNQKNSNINPEETALLFAEKGLFHDAVRVLFEQQETSPENWNEKLQELRDISCSVKKSGQ